MLYKVTGAGHCVCVCVCVCVCACACVCVCVCVVGGGVSESSVVHGAKERRGDGGRERVELPDSLMNEAVVLKLRFNITIKSYLIMTNYISLERSKTPE